MKQVHIIVALFSMLFVMHQQDAIAQIIPYSVVSGGATNTKAGNTTLRGTLTQSSIGRLSSGNTQHNVGFWYAAQNSLSNGGTLVVIPQTEANTGEKITIPLFLQQSKNLITTSFPHRSFKATIRYNATVLESISNPYKRVGDVSTISIEGSTGDSAGVLAKLDFITKLGNADRTSLEIVAFSWTDAPTIKTITKNGEMKILNVCRVGDSVRLVREVTPTTLAAYPNPATNQASLDVTLGENGTTIIELLDTQGKVISTILSGSVKAGKFSEKLDLLYVPNGIYFIRMQTPNELFTLKFSVHK